MLGRTPHPLASRTGFRYRSLPFWHQLSPIRGKPDARIGSAQGGLVSNFLNRVRRLGLVVSGVGSAFLGLVVAWTLVQPGVIGGVGTGALLAIFGLLTLPGLVYWVWRADIRAAARQAARARTLAESRTPQVITFPVQQLRLSTHEPVRGLGRDAGRDTGPHTHAGTARAEGSRPEPHRSEPRRRVAPAPAAASRRSSAAG